MKTLLIYIVFGSLLLVILSAQSCGTYYYAATKQNVMKFKEKGDVNVELASGFSELVQHATVGYAVTDHWALSTSYTNIGRMNEHDYIWDNEAILFHSFSNDIVLANNFGFSFGKLNSGGEYFNLDIFREYIQPSVGFSSDFFEVGISMRITNLHYNLNQVKEFNSYNGNTLRDEFYLYDVGLINYVFLEPALTVGLGYKGLRLRFQFVGLNKMDGNYLRYYEDSFGYYSLNGKFNISDIFGKKKKHIGR